MQIDATESMQLCDAWIKFSLNVFIVITVKGLEPANSCVRDQDATTAPARGMRETGSLYWDADAQRDGFSDLSDSLNSLNSMNSCLI